MDIPCNASENSSVQSRSLELLSYVEPGCWILLLISIHGLINNIILLNIAYRRRWHKSIHYVLIIHQTVIDLLTSLVMMGIAAYLLIHCILHKANIISQFQCMGIFVPSAVLLTYGQRSSLVVAIDRLVNVLFPYTWVHLGAFYRTIMLCVALIWVLVQETVWFAFAEKGACVQVCYSYEGYPETWWSKIVTVGDSLAAILIVIAYLILPVLSGNIFKQLNCQKYLFVCLDRMEHVQRLIVKRVRHLSMLTVISFLCTTFVGFLACDLTSDMVTDDNLLLVMQTFGDALSMVNTVLPLYLFIWRENVLQRT